MRTNIPSQHIRSAIVALLELEDMADGRVTELTVLSERRRNAKKGLICGKGTTILTQHVGYAMSAS